MNHIPRNMKSDVQWNVNNAATAPRWNDATTAKNTQLNSFDLLCVSSAVASAPLLYGRAIGVPIQFLPLRGVATRATSCAALAFHSVYRASDILPDPALTNFSPYCLSNSAHPSSRAFRPPPRMKKCRQPAMHEFILELSQIDHSQFHFFGILGRHYANGSPSTRGQSVHQRRSDRERKSEIQNPSCR